MSGTVKQVDAYELTDITVKLFGRIDAENAGNTEEELEKIIGDAPHQKIILDCKELSYVSSAGLRAILKIKKKYNVPVELIEVSPDVYEIFEVTGFIELFHVKKRLKEISIEGCEVIGSGFYGTVYRIDDETIVKVYQSQYALSLIENERDMARKAFVRGIPTAISYDIVRVGDSYGSVFELIRSKTFNDMIVEEPERADEFIRQYVDFLKLVHSTDMAGSGIHSAKKQHYDYIDRIREYINPQEYEGLRRLVSLIPDSTKAVHGDIQMKNVMLSDGEPLLIDMDTLSCGNPVFDLQGIYITYQLFKENEPDNTMNFLGIDACLADRIWDMTFLLYYSDKDEEDLPVILRVIKLIAVIRFLFIIAVSDLKNGELGTIRIRHAREHITNLMTDIREDDFDRL